MDGQPFLVVYAFLLVVVFCRAQATYWLARAVSGGAIRWSQAAPPGRGVRGLAQRVALAWARLLQGPRMARAIRTLHRWGAPAIAVSFLTIGFQTAMNGAAGLTRMPWPRYLAAMLPGCAAWAAIYATVGMAAFYAGLALAAESPWALAALGAVALAVAGALVVRRLARARARVGVAVQARDSG